MYELTLYLNTSVLFFKFIMVFFVFNFMLSKEINLYCVRFLDMSLDESSGIRKQDTISVFYSVARSSTGFYVAREFLYTRIKDIHAL